MKLSQQVKDLRYAMRSNKLVIFVGAGVSANSNIPLWGGLVKRFAEELNYDKCNKCKENKTTCNKDVCNLRFDFTNDEYLKIPQYFYNQNESNLGKYYGIIKSTLGTSGQSNAIDDIILRMLPHHIITTNYDKLLENSKEANTRFYSVIKKDNDLLSNIGTHYIIKMHGDIDEVDTIVLKENDYLEYSQKHVLIETYIKSLLIDHTFLFVGYSINDYNLKLILSWINQFYKNNSSFKKPKNFIIQATNSSVKSYEKDYFLKNNLIIFSIDNLPTSIIDKFPNLTMNEYGKKLYCCLDYILDESNDFLIDSFEDVIFERYQILSEYNRISKDDLLAVYSFKRSEIKAGILIVHNKKEYESLLKIVTSVSTKSEFIKSMFIRTGVNYIQQIGYTPIEILVENNEYLEDELFDLYLDNNYEELLEMQKRSQNILARAYYFHICIPQNTDSSILMATVSNEDKMMKKLINLIIFKYNNILLKGHLHTDLITERNELNSIFSSLPQDINFASKYMQSLYDGLPESYAKMKTLFYEHESFYTRDQNTFFLDDTYGKLFEIQTVAYDYYFFIKKNYLMFDFYSNPKFFFETYIMSMLCTFSPFKKFKKSSSLGADGQLKEYTLNKIDIDMIVKFTNPSTFKTWLKQYKVERISVQEDVDVIKMFENLCKTICFSTNQYFIVYLHSFSILLTKLELNFDQISNLAHSTISLAKYFQETNARYLTRLTESFLLVSQICKNQSKTLLTPLLDLLIQKEVIEEFKKDKLDDFVMLINALSDFSNDRIKGSVLGYLDSKLVDITKSDFYIFRKIIGNDDVLKRLNGNIELLSNHLLYQLILDKTIPYSDKVLSLIIQKINEEIKSRDNVPGVRAFPDHLKYLIDQCIILYLVFPDVKIEKLRQYIEYSDYLQFLIDPDNFDFSKVDTSDYMWVNFFRHSEFNHLLIEHKKEILTEKLEMSFSNELNNLEQAKIVFGILLDENEIWEFGNL